MKGIQRFQRLVGWRWYRIIRMMKRLKASRYAGPRYISRLRRQIASVFGKNIALKKISEHTEAPLRETTLSKEGLESLAKTLAVQEIIEVPSSYPFTRKYSRRLRRRFSENCHFLEQAYFLLAEAAKNKEGLSSGAEWLLDNYHIIEQHTAEIKRFFPKGYDQTLPRIAEGPLQGFPRVYHLALEIVSHSDATIDKEILTTFLVAYQETSPLTLGELWAVPIMLKFALVENLRRLMEGVLLARDYTLRADKVVTQMLASARAKNTEQEALLSEGEARQASPSGVSGTQALLTLANLLSSDPELTKVGAVYLLRRLREQAALIPLAVTWFEEKLRELKVDPEETVREDHQRQAFDQVSIGNSVTSLRRMSTFDWPKWVEGVSLVDRELLNDPSRLYAKEDFDTRDMYRHRVERYARRMRVQERDIAQKVVTFAQSEARTHALEFTSIDNIPKQSHIGYYLIGKGRTSFERSLSFSPPFIERTGNSLKENAFTLYIIGVALGSIALLIFISEYLASFESSFFSSTTRVLLLLTTFLIPASDIVINVLQWFVSHLAPPVRLPKLSFDGGLPEECTSLVAVHGIFHDEHSIIKALEALEVRFLANDDPRLTFALLADYADASEAVTSSDSEVKKAGEEFVAELNERHGFKDHPKFYILFRSRKWNPSEGKFMCWERKRGKIDELNQLILNEAQTSFEIDEKTREKFHSFKYVVTLDLDSQLPYGTAKKLIGTLAHPLNRAVLDPTTHLVVEGYSVLQPRVSVSLTSAHSTWFAKIFSGQAGLDPYASTISEFYQDLFGEGSYAGKGAYQVKAFHEALKNRVPENSLLSHDLFEGNFARAALVSDIELFDEFPTRYPVYAKRQHRWVRGDFQLLPWLGTKAPVQIEKGRELRSNPLSLLEQWKIVDNLRRSLIAPSLFLFLISAWTFFPGQVWFWNTLALLVIAFPIYANIAQIVLMPPLGLSLGTYVKGVGGDLAKHTLQALLLLCFLPHQAWLMTHAISVTLYRLYKSKKSFLEWETAYHSEMSLNTTLGSFLTFFREGIFLTLAGGALLYILGPSGRVLHALPFFALWLSSPFIALLLSIPRKESEHALDEKEKNYLEEIAKETWKYFKDHLTPEHNFLIPDNVQLSPQVVVAPRTSPTNFGLAFLACVSSHDFGFESLEDTVYRIKSSFLTLAKLERFQGHFLNWYDTLTLAPLHPRYVSFVDSGNFICCLFGLREACREYVERDLVKEETREDLRWIINECSRYIDETNFSVLFDPEKNLFPVGYNVDNGRKDPGSYDLLASEARLGSFIAVAKGDVPYKHWFALGRSLGDTEGGKALLSWSGTMFEYLMPLLLMKDYPTTLLSETYKAVVSAQIKYGNKRGVPWGISESAYSGVDFHSTYQYRAFGVPGLGLKRGLETDLVISPYSTVLALPVVPDRAIRNLKELEREGLRGEYGFFESCDYTAERLSGESKHIVKAFFAHHQGMSLLSITNLLLGNVHQERFHRDPIVKASDLLLHERFPQRIPLSAPHQAALSSVEKQLDEAQAPRERILTSPYTPVPITHILSNGDVTTMVDNEGSGFTLYAKDLALTRWKEDGVTNSLGYYLFITDLDEGHIWSTSYQPTRSVPDFYEVLFQGDKIEFKRKDHKILLTTEITVAVEDNVEVRRLNIANLSNRKRRLLITSFAEVVLGQIKADAVHPAFSKLFIETSFDSENSTLFMSRRPRSHNDQRLYLFHGVAEQACWDKVSFESSRSEFLGRGNSIHSAQAVFDLSRAYSALGGTQGSVLDPIMALRSRVELEPGKSTVLAFTLGVSSSEEEIQTLARKYQDLHYVTRAFEVAWSKSSVELRNEQFTHSDAQLFQLVGNALFFPIEGLRPKDEVITQNTLTQSGLWRFGISGDLPIFLLRVNDHAQLPTVRKALLAHYYLRSRGIQFDLVIFNEYPGGYFQHLQEEIEQLTKSGLHAPWIEKRGGIFLRTASQLSTQELTLLQSVSRISIDASRGTLEHHFEIFDRLMRGGPAPELGMMNFAREREFTHPQHHLQGLLFANGYGGFSKDGKRYELVVQGKYLPPLPWINCIASPVGGCIISETGGGFTWSENSRENRLTSWANDPVQDEPSEVIYLRDAESGLYWCPTPRPVRTESSYKVIHEFGSSTFLSTVRGISSELTVSTALNERIKWWTLSLSNEDKVERRLEIYLYVDPVLGVLRQDTVRQLVSTFDQQADALTLRNNYNNEFAGRIVALGSNLNIVSYTTDRAEFIGRGKDLSTPYALESAGALKTTGVRATKRHLVKLSNRVGAGYDQCTVLKVLLNIEANTSKEVTFYLAECRNVEELRINAPRYRSPRTADFESGSQREFWEELTSAIQVRTPSKSFDTLVNGWLLYQTLSCRIYGRSALYQSGGAYGFRDQLQDTLAFLPTKPELAKKQILLHATRQFIEGDVQHWWHPPTGRGVRTKFSDDYLWLPYAVARYIEVTGDISILQEELGFLEGPELGETHEAYIIPTPSQTRGTLLEHCLRAFKRMKIGAHGLPLMGIGDWNDGMNHVGSEGKGESVWLAWFYGSTALAFAPYIENTHSSEAAYLRETAESLRVAVEENGWDGAWYRRAYFDDGTPLGSAQNDECQIDSLAQSWSVISGLGDPSRQKASMEQVLTQLVDEDARIIKLLTPPFDKGSLEPGYIKGYLPGIRENGGQYTHAATWVIIALTMLGKNDDAFKCFEYLNPITHTSTPEGAQTYQGEPYVLCGDVYSAEPHTGRAGWSWYTGSSGWLYQAAVEHILGLQVYPQHFELRPAIPSDWQGFSLTFTHKGVTYFCTVERGENYALYVNQEQSTDGKIRTERPEGNVEVRVVIS